MRTARGRNGVRRPARPGVRATRHADGGKNNGALKRAAPQYSRHAQEGQRRPRWHRAARHAQHAEPPISAPHHRSPRPRRRRTAATRTHVRVPRPVLLGTLTEARTAFTTAAIAVSAPARANVATLTRSTRIPARPRRAAAGFGRIQHTASIHPRLRARPHVMSQRTGRAPAHPPTAVGTTCFNPNH